MAGIDNCSQYGFMFCTVCRITEPRKSAEARIFLIFNREVTGSNVGRGTDYPDWNYSSFPYVLPGK
jgi:hypothetical protein